MAAASRRGLPEGERAGRWKLESGREICIHTSVPAYYRRAAGAAAREGGGGGMRAAGAAAREGGGGGMREESGALTDSILAAMPASGMEAKKKKSK